MIKDNETQELPTLELLEMAPGWQTTVTVQQGQLITTPRLYCDGVMITETELAAFRDLLKLADATGTEPNELMNKLYTLVATTVSP